MDISQNALNGFATRYHLRIDPIEEDSWKEKRAYLSKEVTGMLYLQATVNWKHDRDFIRVSCGLYGHRRIGSTQERSFASMEDAFKCINHLFNKLSVQYKDIIQQAVLSEPAYIGLTAVKATLKACNQTKAQTADDCEKSPAALASPTGGSINKRIAGAWYRNFEDRWMMHFVSNTLKVT